jgi:hypothetical protein
VNGSRKVALAALVTAVGLFGRAVVAGEEPGFRWADGRTGSGVTAAPRDAAAGRTDGEDVSVASFTRDPLMGGDRALFLQSSGVAATVVPTPTRRPLMNLLDQAGLAKPLDDAKIKVFGYVEGSYTKNLSGGEPIPGFDRFNPGRLFDFEPEDPTLNQVALSVERTVAYRNAKAFDVGFRVDTVYGSDARFIHANGLDFYNDPQPILDFGADEQFDLFQAYVDVAAPVGNGLRVRLGKFAYFKTIDPNVSPFYSRSFSYNPQALPFTLTGGLASYAVDNKLLLEGGVVRGWDQALKDNNGSVSFVAGALYQFNPSDPKTPFVYAKAITGPEVEGDTGAYRTVVDVVFGFSPTDGLNLFVDALYGQGSFTAATEDARWYGAAGYALYKVSDVVTVNGRLEWYRDEDGATLGAAASFYAATLGVTITPFPKDPWASGIKIRPEVRYDYATTGNFNGDHDQVTVAVDAIVNF